MHFGFIPLPYRSHLSAFSALEGELVERGHRVTYFHQPDIRSMIGPTSRLVSMGLRSHPPGTLAGVIARAADPRSYAGLKKVISDMAAATDMLCKELPCAARAAGVDALVVDQMEPAGGLVADHLDLPFVSVGCALPINRHANHPLPVMPFRYRANTLYARIYEGSTRVYDMLMKRQALVIEHYASAFGLPARSRMDECLSARGQVLQTTAAFDLPRTPEPHLHHVGPLRRSPERCATHVWRTTPARRLVFASLGTLQGHRFSLFRRIAQACRLIDCDLLIAHCGGLNVEQARQLEGVGATQVVSYTDQLAALRQADAVVTHGGLNTVMDAITTRTPMLVLPLAFDQPGVAARVIHHQMGLKASARLATAERIATSLTRLMGDDKMASALATQHRALAAAGGVRRAADIIIDVTRPCHGTGGLTWH